MEFALAILPIALIIALGYGVARWGVLPRDSWGGIETLSFRLLIPAVLFRAIIESDLSSQSVGPMVWALLTTLAIVGASILLARPILKLPDPQLTTVFQTAIRWNAFVSLAAAELFIGTEALAVVAIAMAVLIVIIQVVSILVLTAYGTAKTGPRRIAKIVAYNPILQACALGLVFNLLDVSLPAAISETLRLVGNAALGIGLLAVGAGTRFSRLIRISRGMVMGTVARLIVCPMLFLGVAQLWGLGQTEVLIGLICLVVPAASNGYIISKQMGGDADLYADILTWQTLVSMVALPAFASLAV